MTIKELIEKLREEKNDEDEVSVGLDVEDGSIVASLSVYRKCDDEVVDVMTEDYRIMGFATERKG